MRRVLITGSAGHLGKAMRAAFIANGDHVTGVDCRSADVIADLNFDLTLKFPQPFDVVVCNAKVQNWKAHHSLAMLARRCIVNIGSIYGALGSDPSLYKGTGVDETPAWYVAAKGALIALTRHQATTMAPVRSNCILPGGILRGHNSAFVNRYASKVPLGRMAREEDVVPLVMFLASEAASYITGTIIPVDGGLSARA